MSSLITNQITPTAASTGPLPFVHSQFGQVRVILRDEATGEPWFVAGDVLQSLGYVVGTNAARLISHVPGQRRGLKPIKTSIGTRTVATLSQQGLYFFLGRSDKPRALPYQMWIAGEVVPSIRKHGMYATPTTVDAMLSDPDTAIRMLTAFKQEQQGRLEAEARARAMGTLSFHCRTFAVS